MTKLNFGCGNRIAEGWTNIDFHSSDSRVKRVNLLRGFPYPDDHFEAVYSSHVLEHFTRQQALFLLSEAHRVLKPAGVVRIVVPDLAGTCAEYLRILALPDGDESKAQQYEWILIELLDQLVRSRPGGEMGPFLLRTAHSGSQDMRGYVHSRVQNGPWIATTRKSFQDRLRGLTRQKVHTRLIYEYLRCVGRLVPTDLRSMVLVQTGIGERHRWMYDLYGLKALCEKAGFVSCGAVAHNTSAICGFDAEHLDSNPDGSRYKNNSIYLEALKH